MSDELLNLNAQSDTSISLEMLEKVTGIKKEVIQSELGITTDNVDFAEFKNKVKDLTQDTFNS